MAAPVMACRINSAWLMLQAESLSANSAYSSSVMRVLTTRLRCGVLYRFRMVKPPFCAWCPLTNRRKTGCEAELFLKNPKKYFEGFLSGASRISRVWGRHSPTRFPQGQNERKANFGTAVESCSKTAADCPRLVLSHIERTGQDFRPAVGGLFSFPLKIHFKGRQLPAVRGFFKFSFALVIRETGFWQPTGQRIFPFTPYNTAF